MLQDDAIRLIAAIEDIAAGNYSNDIMGFTTPGNRETIARIAEAVGMMMVRIEAREHNLQMLVEELKKANALIKRNTLATVAALAEALGARDEYTKGHSARVAAYAARLAKRLNLPEEEVERIRTAGLLHDIGKIGFSDRIFANEDTVLTPDMLEEVRTHPGIGAEILSKLEFLGPAVDYLLCHHERLDGRGYPDGRRAGDIPTGARLLSVADVYDALTTDRPYQKGKPDHEAFGILRRLAGTALDLDLVERFIEEITQNGREP